MLAISLATGVLTIIGACASLTVRQEGDDQRLLLYKGSPARYVVASRHPTKDVQLVYYGPRQRAHYAAAEDEAQDNEDYYYKPQGVPKQPQLQQPQYAYQPGLATEKELDQIFKNVHRSGLAIGKRPLVEQYLKEVTPTTKTLYGNAHPRFVAPRIIKHEQPEETRTAAKQSPIQYVLQPQQQHQQQQTPQTYPQPYENALQETRARLRAQLPQHPEAYHPALFQKPTTTDETPEESTSQSTIYVSQNFIKKPQRVYLKNASLKATALGRGVEYQNLAYAADSESGLGYQRVEVPRYRAGEPQQHRQSEYYSAASRPDVRYLQANAQRQVVEENEQAAAPAPLGYQQRPRNYHQQDDLRYQTAIVRPKYQQQTSAKDANYPEQAYQATSIRDKLRYHHHTQATDDEGSEDESESGEAVDYKPQQRPNYPATPGQTVRYIVSKPEIKYHQEARYQQEPDVNQENRYRPAVVRFRPVAGGAAIAYQQTLDTSNVRYYRKLTRPNPLSYQDE